MKMSALLYISASALFSLSTEASAANSVDPGQHTISGVQNLCLVQDGTWYGTTFNFSGRWTREESLHFLAQLWGNYTVHDTSGAHKANTTLTIIDSGVTGLNWHDWFDDGTYGTFLFNVIDFVKKKCDPPFQGQNGHAVTE